MVQVAYRGVAERVTAMAVAEPDEFGEPTVEASSMWITANNDLLVVTTVTVAR